MIKCIKEVVAREQIGLIRKGNALQSVFDAVGRRESAIQARNRLSVTPQPDTFGSFGSLEDLSKPY